MPVLRDGFRNAGRRQHRGVVLDPQTLRHHVGVERFEAGETLQRPLEDRHFFVAVHALDPEDRFGVDLTDLAAALITRLGADEPRPPASAALSCTCVTASRRSSTMC